MPLRSGDDRLNLATGQSVELPVAWLIPGSTTLVELRQVYRCDSSHAYRYEAPDVPYRAVLELAPNGFVRRYPESWELETC